MISITIHQNPESFENADVEVNADEIVIYGENGVELVTLSIKASEPEPPPVNRQDEEGFTIYG